MQHFAHVVGKWCRFSKVRSGQEAEFHILLEPWKSIREKDAGALGPGAGFLLQLPSTHQLLDVTRLPPVVAAASHDEPTAHLS